jgi:hypothetical protein
MLSAFFRCSFKVGSVLPANCFTSLSFPLALYSEGKAIENPSYFLLLGASRGCHFPLYLSEVRQWERVTFVPPRSGHLVSVCFFRQ